LFKKSNAEIVKTVPTNPDFPYQAIYKIYIYEAIFLLNSLFCDIMKFTCRQRRVAEWISVSFGNEAWKMCKNVWKKSITGI